MPNNPLPVPFVGGKGVGLLKDRHNRRDVKNYLKWRGMPKREGIIKRGK